MASPHGTPPPAAKGVPACAPTPTSAAGQVSPRTPQDVGAPPTLQDVVAVPGLGARIMEAVPLGERVRMRGLGHAFKASVDASLQAVQGIGPDELFALDGYGRSNGDVLMWLAPRCPNLQVLHATGMPGTTRQAWWGLPIADAVVTHLVTHCRQLMTLKLCSCHGVSDEVLRAVAARCGGLRSLHVHGCHRVTDAGMLAIAAGCRQLEELDLGYTKVTCATMVLIAANCQRLRHLKVNDTPVGNRGIMAIARGCPDLRTLNVESCKRVDDSGVIVVAENCQQLEELELVSSKVGERGTATILSRCTHLKKLWLSYITPSAVGSLGPDSCRQLAHLHISSDFISLDAVRALAMHCTALTYLSLVGPPASVASVSSFAANCHLLEELDVSSFNKVTDACIHTVANNCPRLRVLSLWRCEGVTDAGLMELARRCPGFQALKVDQCYAGNRTLHALARHCPDLRRLDVWNRPWSVERSGPGRRGQQLREAWKRIRVKNDGLAAVLRNCLRLEVLNLSDCEGMSDAAIRVAGGSCKNLRELSLRDLRGSFTDQGLSAMAPSLGALEVLQALECDAVTDVSIVALAQHCPRLKNVCVFKCKVGDPGIEALARHLTLVSLNAAKCEGVTDVGMRAVSEHSSQLDTLSVFGCTAITGIGVMAVASKCKRLRRLHIHRCSLTASDVQAVRGMCPYLTMDS